MKRTFRKLRKAKVGKSMGW